MGSQKELTQPYLRVKNYHAAKTQLSWLTQAAEHTLWVTYVNQYSGVPLFFSQFSVILRSVLVRLSVLELCKKLMKLYDFLMWKQKVPIFETEEVRRRNLIQKMNFLDTTESSF